MRSLILINLFQGGVFDFICIQVKPNYKIKGTPKNPHTTLGKRMGQITREKYPFSKFSFFSEAGVAALAELEKKREVLRFKDGQRIPLQFQGSEGFYCIHEGFCKLTIQKDGNTETIRIIGPNDLAGFGRRMVSPGKYGLVAMSNILASFLKFEDFLCAQARTPHLASEVIQWLVQVLSLQEDRICSLKNSGAKARVAGTLEILQRQFGKPIGGNNPLISIPIDRKTLANLCGIAPEVLSRSLAELEEDKVIKRRGRMIEIMDIEALMAFANPRMVRSPGPLKKACG